MHQLERYAQLECTFELLCACVHCLAILLFEDLLFITICVFELERVGKILCVVPKKVTITCVMHTYNYYDDTGTLSIVFTTWVD